MGYDVTDAGRYALCRELDEFLSLERRRMSDSRPFTGRVGVLEVARRLDMYFLEESWKGEDGFREPRASCYRYGWNGAISFLVDEDCRRIGAPLFVSTPESQRTADQFLVNCGYLERLQQLVELAKHDLADITRALQRTYVFTPARQEWGVEAVEASDFFWVSDLVRLHDSSLRLSLEASSPRIRERMGRRVEPWRCHYIRYTTDPEIDAHYEKLGLLESRQMQGQDSFPGDVEIGGNEFNLYRAAVVVLIGWTMKHVDFCRILVGRDKRIALHNILSIFTPMQVLVSNLAIALEVPEDVTSCALGALTLTLDNRDLHCRIPCGPATPLIEIGEGQALRSVTGLLTTPFYFLLRELRRRYPRDWDKAVNGRETVFRNELCKLFPGERFVKADRAIVIRRGGETVTDIDAAVIDKETGTVGLFQLKWQEPFGMSLKERQSRMQNLESRSVEWIDAIAGWLEETQNQGLAKLIGIKQDLSARVGIVRLFVIGRNFAHFSGVKNDDRAAWGTWPRILRLFAEEYDRSDPIERLYRHLRENPPANDAARTFDEESFSIRDIRVVVNRC